MEIINLKESQWWPIGRLEEFQNRRLAEIIRYAYENIPAYRKKFNKAKIKPSDIKSKKDLWKIPLTTRKELQNNKDFVNKNLISRTLFTGGSTGVPLKYFESAESTLIRWESHLRGWSWNGYYPGKRLAVVFSSQSSIDIKNTLNLTGNLTLNNIRNNIKKLVSFKPQHIKGYVSSLYILALFCLDNKIKLSGIESINATSENLYENQRKVIEKAFNCKVFEEYCCNDGGACAWECRAHQGLHYFMERAIIEDVDGKIAVTDLWNRAMPFIRYLNGDSVKFLKKKCTCGRKMPLIEVKGRTNDVIVTKKGFISPNFLMQCGIGMVSNDKSVPEFRNGICAIQYTQKSGYILEVNLIKNSYCTTKQITNFKKDLSKFIEGMKIVINFVKEIPATSKGKRAFIINEDKNLLKKIGYR